MDSDWFYNDKNFSLVTISAFDKVSLNAYLHNENSNIYVIYAHGYMGEPNEKTRILKEIAFANSSNILIVEQRGQQNNRAKYCTMGINEAFDIQSWIDFIINNNPNAKIILYGQSMGAATIMNCFNLNLPSNIVGAIEDCGYVNLRDQFVFSGTGYGPKWFLKFICSLMCFLYLFHGANHYKMKQTKALSKVNVSFLAIQGDQDEVVDYKNLSLVEKYINKNVYFQKEVFHEAKHAVSAAKDMDRYMKIVNTFISKICLK